MNEEQIDVEVKKINLEKIERLVDEIAAENISNNQSQEEEEKENSSDKEKTLDKINESLDKISTSLQEINTSLNDTNIILEEAILKRGYGKKIYKILALIEVIILVLYFICVNFTPEQIQNVIKIILGAIFVILIIIGAVFN